MIGGGLIAKLYLTLAILWTKVHQAPLSMGFTKQEYWIGLALISPEDLFDPGNKPASPALQEDSLQLSHQGSLYNLYCHLTHCNVELDEGQAGIKIAGRNINNLRYESTLMAESEEWKGLLMKVKEESEKVGLKLNIQKTKIMASGPITSWQIDGKTVQTVTDFIFWGSKITADGDCSHQIKRRLLLERKVMINLDSILKSRDITLPTKVCLVKAMIFPVVMYGCESWTIKKAECWRTNAFELWCWRRLLRVSWTARRSNQSILNKISPEYSLKGLMVKLKLQYFGHLMWRADSFGKTMMLGKTEGKRRRGRQRMRWLDGIIKSMDRVWVNSGSWWWTGRPGVLRFMESERVRHD